jgi:hypothetical protein
VPNYIAKPPTPRIDRGHPLSRGLLRAYLVAEPGGKLIDSASGYHATSSSGELGRPTGPYGRDVSFPGASQYASAPGDGLPVGAAPRTLAAIYAGTNGDRTFASWGAIGFHTGFLLSTASPGNTGQAVASFWNDDLLGVTPIDDGEPHLVLATYDGATLRLYADGTLDASSSVAGNTTGGTVLWLGGAFNAGRYLGSDNLSGVWVWDRALSASEVLSMTADPFAMARPDDATIAILAGASPGAAPASRFRRNLYPRAGSRGVA